MRSQIVVRSRALSLSDEYRGSCHRSEGYAIAQPRRAPGASDEQRGSEVYGAYTFRDAKEQAPRRSCYRDGLRMNGMRGPSGEPPEAQRSVASRTEQTADQQVERNEV